MESVSDGDLTPNHAFAYGPTHDSSGKESLDRYDEMIWQTKYSKRVF